MINQYFMELFQQIPRQGPGSFNDTKKAFESIRSRLPENPFILDIGCGSGVQTIDLAKLCSAHILALDNHEPFLTELEANAVQEGFENNIDVVLDDMNDLPFEDHSFDLIWAEGSLFIVGLENALADWYNLLKDNGYLVFSEAVYLKDEIPEPLFDFFEEEYPDMFTLNEALELINNNPNYQLIDHFTLSKKAWTSNFYDHLSELIVHEKQTQSGLSPEAKQTIQYLEKEIDTYNQYNEYFGYEFFVLKTQ